MPLDFENKKGDPELVKLGIHFSEYRNDYLALSNELKNCLKYGNEEEYLMLMRTFGAKDMFFLSYFILDMPVNEPFLVQRIYDCQDTPHYTMDMWAREHWKAIDIHEPIFTPDGWRKHGDLKTGDYAFSGEGKPVKVVATTEVYNDAECYEIIFHDGYSITCSRDHLWEVEKRTRLRKYRGISDRKTEIMTTEEIFNHGVKEDNRLIIKCTPLYFNNAQDLPIKPYLLGAWLGDGDSANGRITNNDKEVWEQIESLGYKLQDTEHIARTVYGIRPILRNIGVLNNKHIPNEYLFSSYDDRIELLSGLLDTDGTVSRTGTISFVNINERLARDVYNLSASLGLNPMFNEYIRKVNDLDYPTYWVSFQGYSDSGLFKIKRKINRLKHGKHNPKKVIVGIEKVKSIPVSCIQVEGNGTYIVGSNFVKTHNSTIRTCIQPIFEVINNQEERVGIFSHNRSMARSHLRKIKILLEENKILKAAYPDIFYEKPERQAPKWSELDGLYVKRRGNYGEGTFEAAGLIDGMPTGKHYSIRVFDDIVTDQTVTNRDACDKALDKFYHSEYLKTSNGIKRIVGTRYDTTDPYARILKKNKKWDYRCYPAEVDKDGNGCFNGTPVLMKREELDDRRAASTDYQYASQMLQDPTQETSSIFKTSDIKFYEPNEFPSGLNVYILVDPANSKMKKADHSVYMVIGADEKRRYWILDIVRDKLSLNERWEMLKTLCNKWNPFDIGYEAYGMQADLDYFNERMDAERVYFKITSLGGIMSKMDRIMRLQSLFENGRILFPRVLTYTNHEGELRDMVTDFIHYEFEQFPKPKHDDMMDCLSRILDKSLNMLFPDTTTPANVQRVKKFNPLGDEKKNESWMSSWF